MQATIKNLDKSRVEITVTVSPEEQLPHMKRAAEHLATESKIAGFRPGHAPYELAVSQFGEMKILEAALEDIIRTTFVAAVKEHDLKTVGMPDVALEKVAPQNDLVYHATVALMPAVELPDFTKISVEEKETPVADADVEKIISDLQKMHSVEVASDDAAGEHDKVTLDMDLLDGLVPLEGGQARDHGVYLDEAYYIPGFTAKLLGVKADDKLEFALPFPADHYQKLFAGKNINFKVTVKKVEQRTLPAVDDAFAVKMGLANVAELRERVKENLHIEHHKKAEEAAEIELFQKVVAAAKYSAVPEVLIEAERHRLMHDLEDRLQKHGVTMEKYLADMKKTAAELENGFTETATQQVKMSLLVHEIAVQKNIDVTDAELQTELEAIREAYKNNADAIKRLLQPDTQDAVKNSLRNRKVVEWMHETMVQHAPHEHEHAPAA